jgi:mannitol/fructose-specific phosphotransferase system IIA component (Ntr-type)
MKISDIVTEDLILTDIQGKDPASILREFADAAEKARKYPDPDLLFERLHDREIQESTCVGNGIAIPHCKVENLRDVFIAIGYSAEGVDFKAFDRQLTYFFFLVVSPANASVLHLRTLAALSRLLRSANFISHLKERPDKSHLLQLIRQEEEESKVSL